MPMLSRPIWGSEEMTLKVLEIVNVEFEYGGAKALKGISMAVERGQINCLIGANGAGKTTTLRVISGLLKPKSGGILFQGKDIIGLPPQGILSLGIAQVPQEGRSFYDMSVLENLLMGAYLQKDKKSVEHDLAMVYGFFPRLRDRAKQRASSLSGGERQMLAIARALMSKPSVLMMDEPSAGLAPIVVETLGEIVSRMKSEDLSIFLVEQNADMALRVAHYGYVMERGKIVLEGDAKNLFENPTVRQAYLGM